MKLLLLFILLFHSIASFSQEICNNGRDDDFDGKIDLLDEDCACSGLQVRTKELSIIPNHSFESKNCCPNNVSQMKCVNDWIQPSEGTSDFVHACGNFFVNPSNDARVPRVPLPLPDGNGAVGIINGYSDALFYKGVYKEYVATRLWRPLQAGIPYELDMNVGFGLDASVLPPFNVTIWGHPQLTGLPFNYGIPVCPKQYDDQWIILGVATVSGSNQWVHTTIPLTIPVDINCLAIGPDCADPSDSRLYYYFDNLVLYRTAMRDKFYVDLTASPKCDRTVALGSSLQDDHYLLQWFKDGIAITGANSLSLPLKNIPAENGNYSLMATGNSGCALSEPYVFTSFSKLTTFADLGPDVVACPGQTVTLTNPPNEVEAYWGYGQWSTGQAGAQIQVTETGDYWFDLTLHDIATFDTVCHTRDTVHVSFDVDDVDLGPDKLICDNNPITISNTSVTGLHKWNTGDLTANIVVTSPGIYTDTVTLAAGCKVYGSVEVTSNPLLVDLGADVKTCQGSPVHFQPEVPVGTFFLWNNSNVSSSYTAYQTQDVTVSASYEGCVRKDTVAVQVMPAPDVSLGNDTTLCEGHSLILQVPQIEGQQYKWNDGSTAPSFHPTSSGVYSVTVNGVNQCSISDTIAITFSQKPTISVPASVSLCRGSTLSFQPQTDWATQFLWNDGVRTADRIFSQAGTYSLEIANSCGSANGTVLVKDAGVCAVIFPNAFTPNHDSKNDLFISNITEGLYVYMLTIFNRWGQIVFRTSDPGKGWNGYIGSKPAEAGSYVWTIIYRSELSQPMRNEKGSVLLIR